MPINNLIRKRVNRGFTIIELLVATMVFSVILTILVASFVKVGSLFYKANALTNIQQSSYDLLVSIQAAAAKAGSTSSPTVSSKGDPYYYFCIDDKRYTYHKYFQVGSVTPADNNSNFGLLQDIVTPDSCPDPFIGGVSNIAADAKEFIPSQMRLSNLTIAQLLNTAGDPIPYMYQVGFTLAYGSDDYLGDSGSDNPYCYGSANISRFCSVYNLSGIVNVGIGS